MKIEGGRIHGYWQWLSKLPFGAFLFNRLIRFINPYTGALKAKVVEYKPGYCRVELKDRRGIRNHLNSIHAIALTNLGELASGLALLSLFPDGLRGIPVDIHIEFLKKARGRLIAESSCQLTECSDDMLKLVTADIRDMDNDMVAKVSVKWKLGFRQAGNG